MVTVITKTIGPSGRDYANFVLAEADVPNIVGSRDLVGQDKAVVFEADAGVYSHGLTISGTLSTDATRNVTYKAAPGSEHGGSPFAGVRLNWGGSYTVLIQDNYTQLIGIGTYANTSALSLYTLNVDGVVIDGCIIYSTASNQLTLFRDSGTASAPLVMRNTSMFATVVGNGFYSQCTAGLESHSKVVNCTITTNFASGNNSFRLENGGLALHCEIVNCLSLSRDDYLASGSPTVTGSNNFGNSIQPFPVAIQGSPYPITASTAYDPGAGDFALYVGKNGALLDSPNNDVIGGGVGPSVNSDVPTTDILGNARSGATANPGAFEVPQATAVLTRTIGSGKDYASFTLAEADVTNIGGTADLVNENERIVFEADAGTYNETVFYTSTLTTDATRNVTYKPAAGSEHGGDPAAGVILGTGANTQDVRDDYTVLSGLHLNGQHVPSGDGAKVSGCILTRTSGNCASTAAPNNTVRIVYENSVFRPAGTSFGFQAYGQYGSATVGFYNCTFSFQAGATSARGLQSYVVSPYENDFDIVNCIAFVGGAVYTQSGAGTHTIAGSNNFGSSSGPFPVALQGTPYPITASQSADPGAGDYALYVGKNGALLDSPNNDVIGQGVGPAANSDVPLFDILGNFRAGDTANPGAFEIPQATYTWKKTIGPVGRDYATFTLAEADVENIPTSTDLVNENEAIVFEADAATYAENVTFQSALTTDATRQVTYRPAVGSEHGGVRGAGVVISGTSFVAFVQDAWTNLVGLEIYGSSSGGTTRAVELKDEGARGSRLSECILWGGSLATLSTGIGVFLRFQLTGTLPSSEAAVVENCVIWASTAARTAYYSGQQSAFALRNCTFAGDGASASTSTGIVLAGATGGATASVDLVNNIGLEGVKAYNNSATGTITLTGSNNFAENAAGLNFPVAIQGSPYPITATTDTNPGPGDWAIYDAATGALINDSDNDVLAGGVGPSANSDVPETDIVGNLRSGSTADPGAFEISSIPAPLPGLSSDMQQTYQAEAAYTLALTPSGVTNVTHQQNGAFDYLEITTGVRSREVAFPEGAQAVRVVAITNSRPCIVTVVLDDGAGGEVEYNIGYVGGAALSADFTHFWNLSALQSDGTYPKLKFTSDFASDSQRIYVWWHTS
jgi:hypothetical protein